MRRTGMWLVVAVGLTLGASACEQADQLGGQIQSGVEDLQAGLADAADQTGDQARKTYQDLLAEAEDLRRQADTAAGQAQAEAHDAWVSIQEALKDLETRIQGAVDDL